MDAYKEKLIEYFGEKYSYKYRKIGFSLFEKKQAEKLIVLNNCEKCSENKKFSEDKHSLIYSCGKLDDSKCGIKLKINLIKYKDSRILPELKKIIDESLNYQVLDKYFNMKKTDLNKIQKDVDFIEDQYIVQNDIISNEKLLENIFKQRKELYESKSIKNSVEYVEKTEMLNLLYKQALDIVNNLSFVLIYDKPKNIELEKPTKQIKKVVKEIVDKPEPKLEKQQFVKWIFRNTFKFGIIKKVNKKKSIIESDGSEYIVDHKKIKIITKEIYDKNTKDIKESIEIGSIVGWLNKNGEIQSGNIKKINKVKAVVENDSGEYILDYKKLFIFD